MARDSRILTDNSQGRDGPIFVGRRGVHQQCPARHAVTHDHVALTFYTSGSATIEQRSHWSLHEGDVFLVPSGEPHRLIDANRPELWGLGFCPVCFLAEGAAELLEPFERVRSGASAVVTIPAHRRAFLDSLFSELQREVTDAETSALAVQKSLLTLILAEVARAAAWKNEPPGPAGVAIDALRFIERHCLEPISLQDVARVVHRSPAHVTTVLRQATGRSAQAWIIAGRMSEARRRLAHTDEQIDIIAERVGYADATHFIRLFRREHGLTPAAWRKRHRSGSRR